jgi:plastocyanin
LGALLTAAFVIVGTASACGDDDNDDGGDTTPSANATQSGGDDGAQTLQIQIDGDGEDFDAFMIAYFPKAVTAHPGDTLEFKLQDSGEPHTVTAGMPVKALVDFVINYCGPEGFEAAKCQEEPPPDISAQFDALFSELPTLLPEGPGDANQTAANPCFLATGDIPADSPCPEVDPQPAFTGTESLYNSGWMSSDDNFVVKLDPDLAPGTYTFLCLLHGPEMTETVTVVDKSADADTADEVEARRDEELAEFQDALAQAATDLQAFTGSMDPVPTNIQVSADSQIPAGVAEFGPTDFTIPVGGSVTWSDLGGGHTVSFNTPESSKSLRVVADDGTIHVNQELLNPVGVTLAEPAGDPEDPATPPTVTDGGSWDGEGELSTGLASGFFKLTFATAGTYEYRCLIHDGMEGTITVE